MVEIISSRKNLSTDYSLALVWGRYRYTSFKANRAKTGCKNYIYFFYSNEE